MADGERARAREYLIAHPGAPTREVAQAVGCSPRTVASARGDLRFKGLAGPAYGDRRTKVVKPAEAIEKAADGVLDVQTTADLNKVVADELAKDDASLGEVDMEKLKRVLWRVVNRNADDRIVVAAAGTLARIKQETDARPLGVSKPMTEAAAIDRLSMLFKPLDLPIVFKAMLAAFPAASIMSHIMEWLNGLRGENGGTTADVEVGTVVGTTAAAGPSGHAGNPTQA